MAPASETRIVNFSEGYFDFRFGNLASSFVNDVVLTPKNEVVNLDNNRLTVKFKSATGSFTGTVNVPGTTLGIKFAGVISQQFIAGAGHFIGQTQSGRVYFAPDLDPTVSAMRFGIRAVGSDQRP